MLIDAFAMTGAALIGLGFYGLTASKHLLRRVVAFNVIGSGIFLYFGAFASRGSTPDPVPQALIITGIVVALSATALAIGLVVAHARESGSAVLPEDETGHHG
ncbi:NADH-quinone oxidoreductase subunit K (plasmid) [Skermanella sp. TT6]|uniref:NADH-quinone oxidoreductase subunit K n=1 Tax=Skermanella cutis TaxID=2775420 RepID=A0ABX7BFG9_9PROT|nr:NADH-quinone oxidoreductase subunit K [Skermanella sp. TT6]QQP92828.1 NADH-quinone oxidoreductase subunit K [Skermanella sp. TT6]